MSKEKLEGLVAKDLGVSIKESELALNLFLKSALSGLKDGEAVIVPETGVFLAKESDDSSGKLSFLFCFLPGSRDDNPEILYLNYNEEKAFDAGKYSDDIFSPSVCKPLIPIGTGKVDFSRISFLALKKSMQQRAGEIILSSEKVIGKDLVEIFENLRDSMAEILPKTEEPISGNALQPEEQEKAQAEGASAFEFPPLSKGQEVQAENDTEPDFPSGTDDFESLLWGEENQAEPEAAPESTAMPESETTPESEAMPESETAPESEATPKANETVVKAGDTEPVSWDWSKELETEASQAETPDESKKTLPEEAVVQHQMKKNEAEKPLGEDSLKILEEIPSSDTGTSGRKEKPSKAKHLKKKPAEKIPDGAKADKKKGSKVFYLIIILFCLSSALGAYYMFFSRHQPKEPGSALSYFQKKGGQSEKNLYKTIPSEIPLNGGVFFDGEEYNVQVVAFKDKLEAEKAAVSLRERSLNSFISLEEVGSEVLYKVKIGNFLTEKDARDCILKNKLEIK